MNKLLLILCFVSLSVSSQQQITWYGYHQPPASIFEGQDQNQGYVDLLLKLLKENLPQYQHSRQKTTLGRVEKDMKLGKKVCFAALFETPQRQRFALFSKPFMMQPSLRIVLPQPLANKLLLTEPVDLQQVFKQYKLVTGKVSSRVYGTEVDQILASFPHQVLQRVDSANSGLFKMMEMQRIDFIISYPHEIFYALKQLNSKHNYASFSIKGLTAFNHGSIGCSRSQWGAKVITDINGALEQLTQTDSYKQAMTSWLDPQTLSPAYHLYYQQHITGQTQ